MVMSHAQRQNVPLIVFSSISPSACQQLRVLLLAKWDLENSLKFPDWLFYALLSEAFSGLIEFRLGNHSVALEHKEDVELFMERRQS